jgi:hypothetical protein
MCAEQFTALTDPARGAPDAAIPLAKACLLLALEEEAAAAAAAADAAAVRAFALDAGPPAAPLSSSGAATWSLSRLDALAAEARAHFEAHHAFAAGAPPASAAGTMATAAPPRAAPSIGSGSRGGGPAAGLPGLVQDGLALFRQALGGGLPALLGSETKGATARVGSGAAAAGRNGAPGSGAAGRCPGSEPRDSASGTAGAAAAPLDTRELVRRFPLAALGSINAVLFDRHGYAACNRWGGAR